MAGAICGRKARVELCDVQDFSGGSHDNVDNSNAHEAGTVDRLRTEQIWLFKAFLASTVEAQQMQGRIENKTLARDEYQHSDDKTVPAIVLILR